MADTDRPHTLTDLLGGLAGDISNLFRKEIQLAKTEASEKVGEVLLASKGLAIGGILAIGAVGVFLSALVMGLSWVLVAIGLSEQAAGFIASIVVAVVVGIIAWSFISKSLEFWNATRFELDRTTNSLARDAEVVKESL
jgi:hypothetical protein